MNLAKQLFKYNRPVIREFKFPENGEAGDVPYIWDAYLQDRFDDLPKDLDMKGFLEVAEFIREELFEIWTVEDIVKGDMTPVAVVFCKSDGWQMEPHVTYYDNATVKIKLRTYVAFLKKTKYRKSIGACVVKIPKDTVKLANKVEELGLLEYVGKIWGGRPKGNDYIYSVRCSRRH